MNCYLVLSRQIETVHVDTHTHFYDQIPDCCKQMSTCCQENRFMLLALAYKTKMGVGVFWVFEHVYSVNVQA